MKELHINQKAILYCVKDDILKKKIKKFDINDQDNIYQEEVVNIGYGCTIHNLTGDTMIDKGDFAYEFNTTELSIKKITQYVEVYGI